MEILNQVLANGLVLGLTYALLALGCTLVFSIMGLVNLAHADLYMLGGFMVFYLYGEFQLSYIGVAILAMGTLALFGAALERGLFRRVRGRGFSGPMILSLGLSMLIQGIALIVFGERSKGVPPVIAGVVHLGNVSLGASRLLALGLSMVALVVLFLFLTRTRYGQAMRALSQDADAAYLQGIDINAMSMLAFAISAALAALAGAVLTPLTSVSYSIGSYLILKCFIIVVLGGLGSMPGCLLGGVLFGLIESVCLTYLRSDLSYMIIFAIVIVVLLTRPQGLMGRAELQ